MKITVGELRELVREALLGEDLKNVGSKHKRTVVGGKVLHRMHDAPGVLDALAQVDEPDELAQVLQATIDAVPITSRGDIEKALQVVRSHERTTHAR